MKSLKILLLTFATFAFAQAFANSDAANEKIRERIAPVGEVCASAECAGGAVAAAGSSERSGEDVYKAACTACHGTGLLDAPKTGDTAAWDARFEQGEATVLKHAIEGLNAMPPKGTCNDCSDDELLAAIKFMSGR